MSNQNSGEDFVRFIVLKIEDLEECLSDKQIENMKDILKAVSSFREETRRDPEPKYYVVNTDEPFAEEVKKIIENNDTRELE